jgi:phosphate transport system permease protein
MQASIIKKTSKLRRLVAWLMGNPTSLGDAIFSRLTLIFALSLVGILVAMIIILNIDAMPAIQKSGFSGIGSSTWNPVTEKFGALPAIYGTLLSTVIALFLAVPISLGAAIFLAVLAPGWIRGPASFLIEMLAAIPSVILGLWGVFVLVPFVRSPMETWLGDHLGFIPLFHGPLFGVGFLAAGIILAIMIIPIITATSRDIIGAVPSSQSEAMMALGATRWEAINGAVLPYCRSGLLGAVILGMGRALGETMAVTMVIGNAYRITPSLFAPGNTIASKIANEFNDASGDVWIGSLVELALILLAISLIVNVLARLLVWRMTRGAKESRE